MEPVALPQKKKFFLIDLLTSAGLTIAEFVLIFYASGAYSPYLYVEVSILPLIALAILAVVIKRNFMQTFLFVLRVLQLLFVGLLLIVLVASVRSIVLYYMDTIGLSRRIVDVNFYFIEIAILLIAITACLLFYFFLLRYDTRPLKKKNKLWIVILCALISIIMFYISSNVIRGFFGLTITNLNLPR